MRCKRSISMCMCTCASNTYTCIRIYRIVARTLLCRVMIPENVLCVLYRFLQQHHRCRCRMQNNVFILCWNQITERARISRELHKASRSRNKHTMPTAQSTHNFPWNPSPVQFQDQTGRTIFLARILPSATFLLCTTEFCWCVVFMQNFRSQC